MEQNEYYTSCVKDLIKHYKERDFIQMAYDYDEILMLKGIKMEAAKTFFTEIKSDYTFTLTSLILKVIEYDNEPVLVSLNHKWKNIHFDTVYEGATLNDDLISAVGTEPVEITHLSEDEDVKLADKCVSFLDLKPGDIILIEALSEGFVISKFTEENIKSYYP